MKLTPVAFLAVALLIAGCMASLPGTHSVGTITIGGMFPSTPKGIALQRAADIAVQHLNDQGGIGGRDLAITWVDSMCTSTGGAAAAHSLIDEHHMQVIIGGACTNETFGAIPVTEEAGVILMTPGVSNAALTNAGDYVFRTIPSDAYEGKIVADYAWSQGLKTISVVAEDSVELRMLFRDMFKSVGGSIAMDETFDSHTDLKSLALSIVDIYPDAVYLVADTPSLGLELLQHLRKEGYKGLVIASDVLITPEMRREHAADLEGVISVGARFNAENPLIQQLSDTYQQKYQESLPYPVQMAAAYDSVIAIADAIGGNDGVVDADRIRRYLYQAPVFDGALGEFSFDQNGDPLLTFDVVQVVNGGLIKLN
jgi:branched-chain amino acid transport system substrate-binding protein